MRTIYSINMFNSFSIYFGWNMYSRYTTICQHHVIAQYLVWVLHVVTLIKTRIYLAFHIVNVRQL